MYYLTTYEFVTEDGEQYFAPPGGAVPVHSLGPSRKVPPVGLVRSVRPLRGALHLADALGDRPAEPKRKEWGRLVGSIPSGDTLLDWLWSSLTVYADPAGESTTAPLLPLSDGSRIVRLAGDGATLREHRFAVDDNPVNQVILRTLRRLYADQREAVIAGRLQADFHRKTLSRWQAAYRQRDHRLFIPRGLPDEGTLNHDTIVSDDFGRADSMTLGPNWNQQSDRFGIASQTAQYSPGSALEADVCQFIGGDLSSVDHDSQAEIPLWSHDSFALNAGVLTRLSNDLTTFYRFNLNENPSTQRVRLYHSVGGDMFVLSSADVTISGGGEILKGESDGTLQTLTYDGVQRIQQSNTAILTGVRAGIRGAANFAANVFRYDNWRAADIEPPAEDVETAIAFATTSRRGAATATTKKKGAAGASVTRKGAAGASITRR